MSHTQRPEGQHVQRNAPSTLRLQTRAGRSRCRLSLVEAAGVEPASGKVYREEPTYLVRSKVSAGSLERTRKTRPSPINFSLRLRTEACGQSRKMTLFPAVRAQLRERPA